jgi:hypothetical protein
MRLNISINGKDIAGMGLTALDGTLNALMKPSAYKKAVTNENAAMHGTTILSTPSLRRKDKQTISIPFLLRADSLIDLNKQIGNIESELVKGANGSGVNELYVAELDSTYRLYYDSMSSYANFGLEGAARVTIKFTEINPNNRSV